MSRQWKGFNKHCFEMIKRKQVVSMKVVMKHYKKLVRNSEYSKFDNFKKLSEFLVSY